jgi:hypothetical protein
MNRQGLIVEILRELKRQKKSRSFPDHLSAQAAVVGIEAGRLMQQADQVKYGKGEVSGSQKDLREAAIRTIAAGVRFLERIDRK